MQEIAPQVFIERDYPGVTLGLIHWEGGIILIDVPFRPDDIRLWRASMSEFSDKPERLVINLDDHYDRTLGLRQIDWTVVGHEKLPLLLKDRPINIRPQGNETGAEWELHSAPGNIRWSPPEISFSDKLEIHLGEKDVVLQSRPGPTPAAIWAHLPGQKVIFVGDTVMPGAVPFLANADLNQWVETLKLLLQPSFRSYTIVSGRNGLVTPVEIKNQIKILEKINHLLEKTAEKQLRVEDVQKTASKILKICDVANQEEVQQLQRARWGLVQYLKRTTGAQLEQPQFF